MKVDFSPEKETPIAKCPGLFTRDKRRAVFLAEGREKEDKKLKMESGIGTEENVAQCPICYNDFKKDQILIHGEKCAKAMFD